MSLKRKYYTGYTIYDDNGKSYPEFKWVTPKEYWAILDRKKEKKEQQEERKQDALKRKKELELEDIRRNNHNRNAYMRARYRPNEMTPYDYHGNNKDSYLYKIMNNKYQNNNKTNIGNTVRTAEVIARRRRAAIAKRNWLNKYRNNNKVTKRPITYRKVSVY